MPVTFPQLSAGDKKRLRNLAEVLGVPFRFDSRERVKALLRNGQQFSNTDAVYYNGKLVFVTGEDVHTICHDIAHALFLGPLYKRLKNGVSDLADKRWKSDEEGPVMALQCFIADAALYNYGGSRRMVKCMGEFGYGFGTNGDDTPEKWRKTGIKKECLHARLIPEYPELHVYHGDYLKSGYFVATH